MSQSASPRSNLRTVAGRVSGQSKGDPQSGASLEARTAELLYQPLVIVTAAMAAGIVIGRYFVGGDGLFAEVAGGRIVLLWFLAIVGWLAWFARFSRGKLRSAVVWLLVAIGTTAATWHHCCWQLFPVDELSRFALPNGNPVCLEAIALEQPRRLAAPAYSPFRAIPQGERTQLQIRGVAIRDGTSWRAAQGLTELLVDGHLLGISAGDRLQIFGQLRSQDPPQNPGEFDFASHARAERLLARIVSSSPDCVVVVDREHGFTFQRIIDRIRTAGERILDEQIAPKHRSLASAILLGDRGGVSKETNTRFMETGTVHLLVVSGLHVGVLSGALLAASSFGWLPRKWALAATVLLVLFYAAVVGLRPPVVRASALVSLLCVAMYYGRRAVALNSLAAAAIVVLILNPADLFRAGPQLSFLAVATLIWVGSWFMDRRRQRSVDPLDRLIEQSRPWYAKLSHSFLRWNIGLLVATAAVWLTALPLVVSQFHLVTPVAVMISPLVWPIIGLVLLGGFGMLVTDWLLPGVGALFGWICNAGLGLLDRVVTMADSIPGGHWWQPGPATWWVVGFYLGLFVFLVTGFRWFTRSQKVGLLVFWVCVGALLPIYRDDRSEGLHVGFVSLGHGGCTLLRTPSGENFLYDAGAISSPDYAARTVAAYLWERNITHLHGVVLSHADVDHFNALPGLIEKFSIGEVFVSPVMFDGFDASAGYRSAPAVLKRTLEQSNIPIREIWSGDKLRIGEELTLEVLHPPREGLIGNDNSNSLVLEVQYRGRVLLLPGDLETPGIEGVMAELPRDCDIVLAPHHGSRRSDPPGFAAWCTPEWVVVSGGGNTGIQSVVDTYTDHGAEVLWTDHDGAIEFVVPTEGNIAVSVWNRRPD